MRLVSPLEGVLGHNLTMLDFPSIAKINRRFVGFIALQFQPGSCHMSSFGGI